MDVGTLASGEEEVSTVSVSIKQFVLIYREYIYNDTGIALGYADISYLGAQTFSVVWIQYPYYKRLK